MNPYRKLKKKDGIKPGNSGNSPPLSLNDRVHSPSALFSQSLTDPSVTSVFELVPDVHSWDTKAVPMLRPP